jgi:hypothetical protein
MANRTGCNTPNKVEVLFAILIKDIAPLSALKQQILPFVRWHYMATIKLL